MATKRGLYYSLIFIAGMFATKGIEFLVETIYVATTKTESVEKKLPNPETGQTDLLANFLTKETPDKTIVQKAVSELFTVVEKKIGHHKDTNKVGLIMPSLRLIALESGYEQISYSTKNFRLHVIKSRISGPNLSIEIFSTIQNERFDFFNGDGLITPGGDDSYNGIYLVDIPGDEVAKIWKRYYAALLFVKLELEKLQ